MVMMMNGFSPSAMVMMMMMVVVLVVVSGLAICHGVASTGGYATCHLNCRPVGSLACACPLPPPLHPAISRTYRGRTEAGRRQGKGKHLREDPTMHAHPMRFDRRQSLRGFGNFGFVRDFNQSEWLICHERGKRRLSHHEPPSPKAKVRGAVKWGGCVWNLPSPHKYLGNIPAPPCSTMGRTTSLMIARPMGP